MKMTVKMGKPTYEDSSIVNAGSINGYVVKSSTTTMSQLGALLDNHYIKTSNHYLYTFNLDSTDVNNLMAKNNVNPDQIKNVTLLVSASKVAEFVKCDVSELKNFMGTVFAVYEENFLTDEDFINVNAVLKQLTDR